MNMNNTSLPQIIQGGMGAGVSGWSLARAVSKAGQLGVVSGTALDTILARRLQVGDPGGHMRRALENFPVPDVARRIIDKYFVPGGKAADQSFKSKPMPAAEPKRDLLDLLVAGNFAEVFLAREGHDGTVGINYLEKIQLPTLPSLYGAMLAGVSCVLMGAGIPRTIPGVMDSFADGRAAELNFDVVQPAAGGDGGGNGDAADADQVAAPSVTRFDPEEYFGCTPPTIDRPDFYAIVSSATLANMLKRKSTGKVNGFIVEGPTAGGHNAPPRGRLALTSEGEPIYGKRDVADLEAFKALELPFWLAGSYGRPDAVPRALAAGATGVQVGTAFAYCEESDLHTDIKRQVLEMSRAGTAEIYTDPVASPTGFPFKVVQLDNTHSNSAVYEARNRICDLGYLRHAYTRPDGKLGWRCPSEPVKDYLRKGGREEDTVGRKCVCNGLVADIGLGQVQKGGELEKPFVTSGDDVVDVARFLKPGATTYSAADVIERLLEQVEKVSEQEVAQSRSV